MRISRKQRTTIQLAGAGALTWFLLTNYYDYLWRQSGFYLWYLHNGGADSYQMMFIAGFVLFVGLLVASNVLLFVLGIFSPILRKITRNFGIGAGRDENVARRRLRGMYINFVMLALIALTASVFAVHAGDKKGEVMRVIIGFVLVLIARNILMKRGRAWISKITEPFRSFKKISAFGHGGSSSFARIVEEWGIGYKKGAILLGASLYASKRNPEKIGLKDDRHFLTIAATRSGKGRSSIIPNLIEWPYSALVIDPKGTNAAVTAARRGNGGGRVTESLGQNVHVVDPFGIVDGVHTAHFNPLEEIDLQAITVKEDIELIADALVVPEGGSHGEHWNEGCRILIAGILAQLLTRKTSGKPALMDMRMFLNQSKKDLEVFFKAMAENNEAGSLPMAAASMFDNAGQEEWGAFSTTLTRNTKWIDSKAMERILDRSDFSMADLKNGNTTIYIVLPPHLLEEHKRFMRMFVNMALIEMPRGRRSENPVLFVLDEFYALGKLTLLEKAAGLMAGYNMKLWPIVQNVSQMSDLYGGNWETFVSNAGAIQFFSVGDMETKGYLKSCLGGSGYSALREAEELGRALGREELKQIIIRTDKTPLLLRRLNYDQTFKTSQYNVDPDFGKEEEIPVSGFTAPMAGFTVKN